jgi:hypothetical protein
MRKSTAILSIILTALLALTLLSGTAKADYYYQNDDGEIVYRLGQPQVDEDGNWTPDSEDGETQRPTTPGPDETESEYPSRGGNNGNWDGSGGAGGPFSSDF